MSRDIRTVKSCWEYFDEVTKAADAILVKRAEVYDNDTNRPTWSFIKPDSILAGVIYRAERARATQDMEKKLDDIYDAINYLRFAGALFRQALDRNNNGTT